MPNLVNVKFENQSIDDDSKLGMRPMQARVFEKRNEQYLLVKAPPASGKSRALMFVGLDKLINQGIKKVIVAVPEMSIGSSFKTTDLMSHGFFANWEMDEKYNLCQSGSHGKAGVFREFLTNDSAKVLLCTHATFRLTLKDLDVDLLNNTLIAIDEFHHVSESGDNQLGNCLDMVMRNTNAHITAMTGSYFRGDTLKILSTEDEAKFKHVSYSYYEQIQSYKHLKSLGIGYHFYRDGYLSGLGEVLDVSKKTIIHIPNVNSRESTGDKYAETDAILDVIRGGADGELSRDANGIYHVPTILPDGTHKTLKVADLVDDGQDRPKIQSYLDNISSADDLDIIIALNMAQEGFDWIYCEHALTIGFRSSLTQKIQIIGRATRDCEGKEHAQFTNLIAEPDASSEEAAWAVNNMLKAISVSLLMEQVLAPKVNFKIRGETVDDEGDYVIEINTWDKPPSEHAKKALENRDTIIAELTNDTKKLHSALTGEYEPEVWLNHHIPKLLKDKYPELEDDEIERLSEIFLTAMTVPAVGGKVVTGKELPDDAKPFVPEDDDEPYTGPETSAEAEPDKKFLLLGNKFVAIDDLNINLIASINPFQKAYEVISREVDADLLRIIQDQVRAMQSDMDIEEAMLLADRIAEFKDEHGRDPQTGSHDDIEHRLAIALQKLMVWAQEQANKEVEEDQEQMSFREEL